MKAEVKKIHGLINKNSNWKIQWVKRLRKVMEI
jgi:hypothetical protein